MTMVQGGRCQRQNGLDVLHDLAGSNVLDESEHQRSAVRLAWWTRVRQRQVYDRPAAWSDLLLRLMVQARSAGAQDLSM